MCYQDITQFGRVLRLGRRCCRFESCYPDVKKFSIIAGSALALFALACGVESKGTDIPTTNDSSVVSQKTSESKKYTPKPEDFIMEVIILDKQCFGSAGCNLTFRVNIKEYKGLPVSSKFTILYSISGSEDGEYTHSLEVFSGNQYEYDAKEFIQTSSSKIVPTATVTRVLPS